MKHLLRTGALKIASVVLLSLLLLTASAKAQTPAPSGYALGFFNGVWNDEAMALNGLAALRDLVGQTWKGEPVDPVLFYNHGSEPGLNLAFLQDIAETFIMRAQEVDSTGFLAMHFELIWEVAFNKDRTFLDRIVGLVSPRSASLIDALYTEVSTKFVADFARSLSSPPTVLDQTRHHTRLDELAGRGKKLMLVAHSQGNLFVNLAYEHIVPTVGITGVATVHIAPASPTLTGAYLLANIDIIINSLRVQGLGSVPAVNLFIPRSCNLFKPWSCADLSGHTLLGTYLDSTRDGWGRVKTMISDALNTLGSPSPSISVGHNQTCLLLSSGVVNCWGSGILGDGSVGSSTPVKVTGITAASAISVRTDGACALSRGSVACWGGSPFSEKLTAFSLIYGTEWYTPVTLNGIIHEFNGAIAMARAGAICILNANHSVSCTRIGGSDILAPTGPSETPIVISGITDATAIDGSDQRGCAIVRFGAVKCWGDGFHPYTVPYNFDDWYIAVDISGIGIAGATAISVGAYNACALLADGGSVVCWDLFNGSDPRQHSFDARRITLNASAIGIAVGRSHACAILADGSAKCWGDNSFGQLGNGETINPVDPVTPVVVSGLTGATAIAAGWSHTCAALADGSAKCWGDNGGGMLGDGTTINSSIPVPVVGIPIL